MWLSILTAIAWELAINCVPIMIVTPSLMQKQLIDFQNLLMKLHLCNSLGHADELFFVFGTFDEWWDAEPMYEERRLSDEMMTYWTNFAKFGNPNGHDKSLTNWPIYDQSTLKSMSFDTPVNKVQ